MKNNLINSNKVPEVLFVSDIRLYKTSRFYVDNEFFDNGYANFFGPVISAIYFELARRANAKTQRCFPSVDTICHDIGRKNRKTVFDGIEILEKHRLVFVDRNCGFHKSNTYVLLGPHVWLPPGSYTGATTSVKTSVTKIGHDVLQNKTEISYTDVTLNDKNKNYKENIDIAKQIQKHVSFLGKHYNPIDIKKACLELGASASVKEAVILLEGWRRAGLITSNGPPSWMN